MSPKRVTPEERKLLPYSEWPAGDGASWENLFREGDLLDDHTGAALHWREATRKSNLKHYARWLGWLATKSLLDKSKAPEQRATPGAVEAYARSLRAEAAPRTVATSAAPRREWIRDPAPRRSRQDASAEPGRRKARPCFQGRAFANANDVGCGGRI